MPSDWKEDALRHKYDPLPEEPRHRKKARKRHVRSDHRHEYEEVLVDAHDDVLRDGEWRKVYHVRDRCKVCGRVGAKSGVAFKVTEGTPVYDVGGFEGLFAKELGVELRVR